MDDKIQVSFLYSFRDGLLVELRYSCIENLPKRIIGIMAEDWVAEGKNKEDLFCTNCPSKILISRAGLYTKCELVRSQSLHVK